MITEKTCGKCKVTKPISEFWKNRTKGDGYKFECKECARVHNKQWHVANAEYRSEYSRKIHWMKRFNITAESYDLLLAAQGGVCAFCGEPCKSGRFLAVDHDHETGKVRGLLCSRCNVSKVGTNTLADALRLIGYLNDPPAQRILSA